MSEIVEIHWPVIHPTHHGLETFTYGSVCFEAPLFTGGWKAVWIPEQPCHAEWFR